MTHDICCSTCARGKLLEQKTPSGRRTLLIVRCRWFATEEKNYGIVYPCTACEGYQERK